LAYLRNGTALIIEAIIWGMLYAKDLPAPSRFSDLLRFKPGTPTQDLIRTLKRVVQGREPEDALTKSNIDGRLRDYLTVRFWPTVQEQRGLGSLGTAGEKGEIAADAMQQSFVLLWLANVYDHYTLANSDFIQILRSA